MAVTQPSPSSTRLRLAALRNRVVKLAELATTPLLPSDYLDLIDPLRSGAALRGRIEAVLPETRDAATVVLRPDRKSTRLNSSHANISYAVFCLKKKSNPFLPSFPLRCFACS